MNPFSQLKTGALVAVLVVCVVIGAGASWWITDLVMSARIAGLNTDMANLKAQHATELKSISDQAQKDTAAALTRMKAAQDALAELDRQKSEELAHAQAENDALSRDVAAGTRRVRIAAADLATCQLTAGRNTSAGAVGDAAQVELTAKAGRNILDIRAGIISDQAKLDYLQGYVRDVVKQCKR